MSSTGPYSFLAVVPRGLQDVVAESLQQELVVASQPKDALRISCWNSADDADIGRQAVHELASKELAKEERQKRIAREHQSHLNNVQDASATKDAAVSSSWFPSDSSVGSVLLPETGRHVSIGYKTTHGDSDDDGKSSIVTPIWSCSGQMAGSAWMQLETTTTSLNSNIIANSRCIGPIMSLITVQHDNLCLSSVEQYYAHSMDDLCSEIAKHIQDPSSEFGVKRQRAMQIWNECVHDQWKSQLSPNDLEELQDRIQHNRLRFRLSCIRQPSLPGSEKKKKTAAACEFTYSRQDFCAQLMDICGGDLAPAYDKNHKSNPEEGNEGLWTISLEEFDLELVVVVLPSKLAIGISLRPYSFLQSRSFACGTIPPDVTAPFLGAKTTGDVVKLKNTTAHILLELADLQDYDVILDPCAGVGTIPLEVDQHFVSKKCVGLGGDLALNNPDLTKVATLLKTTSLMAVWDASFLPIRTSSVDVIVSDLPFGQQCLSQNELNQLLPLVFSECARVLHPGSGRMVVLCGGTPKNLFEILQKWSGKYWQQPVRRVSPMNIGGLLAWIVRLDRNDELFSFENYDGKQQYLDRVRRIARKRDQVGRQRKSDTVEQKGTKRRRRARG